jgi:hypothetical protein
VHTPHSTLFTTAQRTLFGLLGRSLFDRDGLPPQDTDWEEVLKEAYVQTVIPAAFCHARDYEIPETVMADVKKLLRGLAMRDVAVYNGHTVIHRLLSEKGIPYVILKGAASARYYAQSSLRCMGDVDFYVPPSHCETAIALLRDNGFEEIHGNEELHATWKWRGVKFELHYHLPGVPHGRTGDQIQGLFGNLTSDSTLTRIDAATFMCPSAFHHGLILLLHTQQHLLCEGIGLRHICDWAAFVHGMGDDFIPMFGQALEEIGLWRFARILSLAGGLACGLPTAPWMEADPTDRDTAEALLLDVLDGGNFGYKDKDRSRVYESRLISGSEQSNTDGSLVKNGFSAVNRWVRDQWPAARKCPLLLPFGWIYFLLRRLFLVVTGKRKAILAKNTLKNSRKRQDLYKKLGLFKPEKTSDA